MLDLDAIEARADAATEGPWFNNRNGVVIVESHPLAPTVSENSSWGDAEFIAAARADTSQPSLPSYVLPGRTSDWSISLSNTIATARKKVRANAA
jgi:hypothetical protein